MKTHKRFSTLLELLIEGNATPQQIEELVDLTKQERELKQILRSQLEMDNMLSQALSPTENSEKFVEQILIHSKKIQAHNEFEKKVLGALPQKTPINITKKNPTLAWVISVLSLAACLFISILYYNQTWFAQPILPSDTATSNEIQDQGVAIVVNAVGLDNPDRFVIGQSIEPGKVVIKQGFLELEFYRGAQLKVAGPAELELLSAKRVRLTQGKIMTQVPNVAMGFSVDIPNYEVIDLGASAGVQVDTQGNSQVHVFDGSLEIANPKGDKKRLYTGDVVNFHVQNTDTWQATLATSSQFVEFSEIADLTDIASNLKQQQWLDLKQKILQDEHLVAYYDFEPVANKPRLLNNLGAFEKESHGAIVGAKWGKGPWQGKSALEFKRPADRVRVDIDGKFKNFTLASWVKIDSLDRTYSSLLLTDGYKPGDLHWQIANFNPGQKFGTIVLGLATTDKIIRRNYNVFPFFSPADSGTWYHLAVTVDQDQEQVKTYVNGKLFQSNLLTQKSEYWHIGKASIANWDSMKLKKPIRNLNGSMAELIILSRALSDNEIKKIALIDKAMPGLTTSNL